MGSAEGTYPMLDELVAIYAGNYKSIEKYLRFE